jgi:hypothetical protein
MVVIPPCIPSVFLGGELGFFFFRWGSTYKHGSSRLAAAAFLFASLCGVFACQGWFSAQHNVEIVAEIVTQIIRRCQWQ